MKEALKKEEFRKLLTDYAEELSNPENKKVLFLDVDVSTLVTRALCETIGRLQDLQLMYLFLRPQHLS